jgi:hypothetical protein
VLWIISLGVVQLLRRGQQTPAAPAVSPTASQVSQS